jgi:hypothetical protein
MHEAEKAKFYGQEERDKHALAVGKIVLAWSEFQEVLGELYAGLFGKDGRVKALSEWQALKSDRSSANCFARSRPRNWLLMKKPKKS